MLVLRQAVTYHVFFADPSPTASLSTQLVLAIIISDLFAVLKVTYQVIWDFLNDLLLDNYLRRSSWLVLLRGISLAHHHLLLFHWHWLLHHHWLLLHHHWLLRCHHWLLLWHHPWLVVLIWINNLLAHGWSHHDWLSNHWLLLLLIYWIG